MDLFPIILFIIGFLLLWIPVIITKTRNSKLKKEEYLTNIFLETIIGLIFIMIAFSIIFKQNYSEEELYFPIFVSAIGGIAFSLIVIFMSLYRMRYAT
jgi:hypothetical protein